MKKEETSTGEDLDAMSLLRRRVADLEAEESRLIRELESIRASDAEKGALLDASIDRIRIVDREMKILWANRTSTENLGVSPEDIIGDPCYRIFTERDRPCEGCPAKKAMRTGKVEHAVIYKRDAAGFEGDTYWDCYGIPFKNPKGKIDRLIQVIRNVTERVQAEKELERRHNEFNAIHSVVLRLIKEDSLHGTCSVLQEIMTDFYSDAEIMMFLLNPDRDGFFFPEAEGKDQKEACFDRAKKRLMNVQGGPALLTLLKEKRLDPTFTGRHKDHPDVILELAKGFHLWVAVPIELDGRCHGLFMVGTSSSEMPDREDLIFIETLIRQISGIIRYQVSKEAREEAFRNQLAGPDKFIGIVGRSQPMQAIYRMIQAVADSPSTVLITGESGTGKELLARAIHQTGRYKESPFISAHCSSFVPTLVHSELFGHEKGAFTGASSRKLGRLERAQGGILFLDEVADLPMETQVLLLRFLQDRRFERVGGQRPVEVDVRVIAATNKDMEKEMAAGRVREDFYYRLNVIRIKVPPLRDRINDVPLLANHFLRTYGLIEKKEIKAFDREAMKWMMEYSWPGNVRELQNVIAKCVVLASGGRIRAEDLPKKLRSSENEPEAFSLADNEKRLILRVMEACRGNKHEAARLLRISRSTLYSKLRRHNLWQG